MVYHSRSRTYSSAGHALKRPVFEDDWHLRLRRMSHDEKSRPAPCRIKVEDIIRLVLEQGDTDGGFQISITDAGPKIFSRYSYQQWIQDFRHTKIALARDHNRKRIVLDEARLTENLVDRLSRMIKNSWHSLTRRIDGDGLEIICADPKNRTGRIQPRIYVPHHQPAMVEYYRKIASEKSLNSKPGILALAMNEVDDGRGGGTFKGIPFVVIGARFNEVPVQLGFLLHISRTGQVQMAKGLVEHFIFEVKHYNKILNDSRSYYLARSQPPFLTDMALQIYNQLDRSGLEANRQWLKRAIQAAIKEYHTIWVAEPPMDPKTGLSRYRPEDGDDTFHAHPRPYAAKHGLSINEFSERYNNETIREPELDEYFLHDRAVRESGHDTTYRLEKRCANLGTIDLQSLLCSNSRGIRRRAWARGGLRPARFPPSVESYANPHRSRSSTRPQSSAEWFARAEFRREAIDKYYWDESKGLYFDYDTVQEKQSLYESATSFWPLWAGCASEEQGRKLVSESLKKFEVLGGLVSGTEESRGKISLDRPNRQWDYPYAWPPHQIVIWVGLERYGYLEDAQCLAYRFLYMMMTAFVDFNGVVPEKFDAVRLSHLFDAEYGNQGIDFKMVPREGFGWMNAAYQVGLSFLTNHMRRAVAACTSPEVFFRRTIMGEHTAAPPSSVANDLLGLGMESHTHPNPIRPGIRHATVTAFILSAIGT
ncbi:trehalase-domain-containing protein [Lactifluus subvellereus]|nr:trehalase-domain-containing protein [Lactifluus subvellereus]